MTNPFINNNEKYLDYLLSEVTQGNIEVREFVKKKLQKLIKIETFNNEILEIIEEMDKKNKKSK